MPVTDSSPAPSRVEEEIKDLASSLRRFVGHSTPATLRLERLRDIALDAEQRGRQEGMREMRERAIRFLNWQGVQTAEMGGDDVLYFALAKMMRLALPIDGEPKGGD